PRTERRPTGHVLTLGGRAVERQEQPQEGGEEGQEEGGGGKGAAAAEEEVYTGPGEILHRAMLDEEAVRRFETRLEASRGSCLLCRVEGGRPFDHAAATCPRRWPWIRAKAKTLQACRDAGRPWIAQFAACYRCYMPQLICTMADPEARATAEEDGVGECRFRDMVMPLCYGAFFRAGPRALIKKHFPRAFKNIDDYMHWLGESSELGGAPCVQAARVADVLLREIET
ncbi:uncharacterized protein J7T54_003332, partial [Emericellopsis cladophorae]